MKIMRRIKIVDILIIFFIAGLTGFLIYNAYVRPHGTLRVLVRGPDMEWSFPINANETIVVPGPLGNTVIRISDNRAWMESSPCANQVCVAAGAVNSQGQWSACLPNHVLVMIHGVRSEDVDAVSW